MRFYGRESVIEMRMMHQEDTGKVMAGSLKVKGSGDSQTSVAYSYLYVWPQSEHTGIGEGGMPSIHGRITAFQEGESSAPRADDAWVINSTTYLILSVQTSLNADTGYAVHECDVVH